MNFEIIPLAKRDIADIATYYAGQRPGLDDEFLAEVDSAVVQIRSGPLRFEEIKLGIRRCSLQRFQYAIYFRIAEDNKIRIIVVRHHSRRPGFGLRRK